MQQLAFAPQYTYERHRPEATDLYKVVLENIETFLSLVQEECGRALPDFVVKEFREYLRCGILAHGFLRTRCEKCHNEHLVAFSCKRRGFCPSCGARRMNESAIHLVDEVWPVKPVRQWVLSFPIQIRLLLAVQPKLMMNILKIVTRTISRHLAKKAGINGGATGSVTLIQRFGGSINLNVHFHQLFLDGVYGLGTDGKPEAFHITKAPTPDELAEVLEKIIRKITRHLEKRGIIVRDDDGFLQLNLEEGDALSRLQAGAATYRFALGPNKGKKALTLQTVSDHDHSSSRGLVVKNSGFSLHAGVAFSGTERDKIERLCRYITRPAVALERLSLNARGQVVYRLKKPYDDGTTHIVMSPLELLEKLAAIIPRPRVHLTRYSGVFAPHYKYRSIIVPKREKRERRLVDDSDSDKPARMSWARLLKRVFDIDISICRLCQGKTKVVAAIEDPHVIKKILLHLGLPYPAPTPWPARAPPELDREFHHQTSEFDLA